MGTHHLATSHQVSSLAALTHPSLFEIIIPLCDLGLGLAPWPDFFAAGLRAPSKTANHQPHQPWPDLLSSSSPGLRFSLQSPSRPLPTSTSTSTMTGRRAWLYQWLEVSLLRSTPFI